MKTNWKDSDVFNLRKPSPRWFAGNAQRFVERLLHLPEGSVVFRAPNGTVVTQTTTLKQLRQKWEGK